jgi:uncharacterized protein with von Willebrand factor type A (vWA) domain
MSGLQRQLLAFGRLLRCRGLDVHTGRLLDASEALTHVDLASRDQVFHTLRALLVHRHEDLEVFDRAFEEFWALRGSSHGGSGGSKEQDPPYADNLETAGRVLLSGPAESSIDRSAVEETSDVVRAWSDVETLAAKDFAAFTPAEMQVARAALDRLSWNPGARRTRRWVRGRGRRIDLRRALAASRRTGGDVVTLPTRMRKMAPRPLVLLCDVSGSMERYSRMLLHFAHVLGQRQRRLEVFLFSTQLTRITRDLRVKGVDHAVANASRRVPDWSGGTRIGEALRQFHQRWARRVLHRGPVVLLISDGWDRGEPALLRDEIARLQRSCHRLVWLNPLAGALDYEPLTRGLVAALPFVDDFLPARTLTDLSELALHLNSLN